MRYVFPLAGVGGVGVLLVLGGDDGEGARGGEDEGPPKSSSSSLSGLGGERGSTGAVVFPISLMWALRHRMEPWSAYPNICSPPPPTKSSAGFDDLLHGDNGVARPYCLP
jgi:hypothetical protein